MAHYTTLNWVLQTMTLFDTLDEISRYVEFKATLRQVFPVPLSDSIFFENCSGPRRDTFKKYGGSSNKGRLDS